MKELNQYIDEKLIVNNSIQGYKYHPETKQELIFYIKEKIKNEGLGTKNNPLNLNDIDTSKIEDMSILFDVNVGPLEELSKNGYFNISQWDVSNVINMGSMFHGSNFNGDISKWKTGNVRNMHDMFCKSKFDGDISKWNVSNVENMSFMFWNSNFDGNISEWDVSEVKNMTAMFYYSKFTGENGDISKWNVKNVNNMKNMFFGSAIQKIPKWYKQ